MKTTAIRELTSAELEAKVKELKQELFNLRFQQATNNLDNPMRMVAVKKDIARIKTILAERMINEAEEAN
jgi:large subunit ribosomal protein L29